MGYKNKNENTPLALPQDFISKVREGLRIINTSTKFPAIRPAEMSEQTLAIGKKMNDWMPDAVTPNWWLATFCGSEFRECKDEVIVIGRSFFMAKYGAERGASFLEKFYKLPVEFQHDGEVIYRTWEG